MMIEMALKTPSVEKNGVSYVDPDRMDRGLAHRRQGLTSRRAEDG